MITTWPAANVQQLAVNLHPLFQQRGVPGTHELDRLLADLGQIRSGKVEGLRLPVFNKSIDDRVAKDKWRSLEKAPRLSFWRGGVWVSRHKSK